mgnify:CR=1 FL=1
MKNRKYWYTAIENTPASEHIHCNRVMKGESYLIGKFDENFVTISGWLFDKDGGKQKFYDKLIHKSLVQPFVKLNDQTFECVNTCPNG